jgi:hypothetical protein
VALEAALAYTVNIGKQRDLDHYWPDPDDLLQYIDIAQQTRRRVDKLAAPKRKKTVIQRPGRTVLQRPGS